MAVGRISRVALQGVGLPLHVLRTPWYYGWTIVAVAFLSVGVAFGMRAAFGVLLVALVDAFGWGRGLTAGAIALNAVLAAASAPLLGALLDRWGPRWVFGGGVLHVVTPQQEMLLYAYAALFALGFASRQGLVAFMIAALAQGRSLGAVTGIVQTHIALGIAVGPALGGWLFDLTGSYQSAFALALVSTVAATVGIWLAAPRRGSLAVPSVTSLAAAPA